MSRVLLWDLDGTLVTWTSPLVIAEIARRHLAYFRGTRGLAASLRHVPAAYRALLKGDGRRTLNRVYSETLGARLGRDPDEVEAEELAFVRDGLGGLGSWIRGIPPARALFQALARAGGFRHVAATNPTMPQPFNAARLGWAGYRPAAFELITGTEVVTRPKRYPRFYRDLLARLGVAAADCVMIGNDPAKDLPAAALGIPVFLLETAYRVRRRGPPGLDPAASGDYDALARFLGAL